MYKIKHIVTSVLLVTALVISTIGIPLYEHICATHHTHQYSVLFSDNVLSCCDHSEEHTACESCSTETSDQEHKNTHGCSASCNKTTIHYLSLKEHYLPKVNKYKLTPVSVAVTLLFNTPVTALLTTHNNRLRFSGTDPPRKKQNIILLYNSFKISSENEPPVLFC